MKGHEGLRHEDAAMLGYRNELDPQLAEHYELGLRWGKHVRERTPVTYDDKRRATEFAIKYLRQDWPRLIRQIEADAIEQGIEPLILAFRRWCMRQGYAEPTIEQFREMLLESAEIRADLDHADEVGVPHEGRRITREVLHPPAEEVNS